MSPGSSVLHQERGLFFAKLPTSKRHLPFSMATNGLGLTLKWCNCCCTIGFYSNHPTWKMPSGMFQKLRWMVTPVSGVIIKKVIGAYFWFFETRTALLLTTYQVTGTSQQFREDFIATNPTWGPVITTTLTPCPCMLESLLQVLRWKRAPKRMASPDE